MNTATGAADVKSTYGMGLNNKTLKMRIITSLMIYTLATKYVRQLNVRIILTNTDGIKIALDQDVDIEQIHAIAQPLEQVLGIHFKIEKIDRIIIKDANNFVEFQNGKISNVADALSKGYQGQILLTGNLDHPIIVDIAICELFTKYHYDDLVNNKVDVIDILKTILCQNLQKHFVPYEWALIVKPTVTISYVFEDQKLEQACRFYFAKNGNVLEAFGPKTQKAKKIRLWPTNQVCMINSIQDFDFQSNVNLDAY